MVQLVFDRLQRIGVAGSQPRHRNHTLSKKRTEEMPVLLHRETEIGVLLELVSAVRDGDGRSLVVHGEPGVGKTALLDRLVDNAAGCRVLRVVGVQSEMELAFAGLHQLCAPLLDLADRLPPPQRDALCVAFGLTDGPPPELFLVGLAVLSLLSEAAGERPLICVVDDLHWIDHASAQVLGVVARRLVADAVGLVFGTRHPGGELAEVPELQVTGLPDRQARTLLDSMLAGPLDVRVREQIVSESGGNPLALRELIKGISPQKLAGGFGLAGAVSASRRIEDSLLRQLAELPDETRRLLLVAAAEPSGEPGLVWRAAGRLGITFEAAAPAVEADVAVFGARVSFRHPLLRSAVYRSASASERRDAHLALVSATDPEADPDRRAWHRAQAAVGPDERVAEDLERSAGRAQVRGGSAAAAAFLERAVLLTADPTRRTERLLAAAQANLRSGSFAHALELLASTVSQELDELQSARVDLLRGQVGFASGLSDELPALLFKAARRLEPLDRDLARDTYLTTWMSALFTGPRAVGPGLEEISRSARNLRPSSKPAIVADLLLDAHTLLVTEGPATAAPALRKVNAAFTGGDISAVEELQLGWFAQVAACSLWDQETWRDMLTRQVRIARDVGALNQLPVLLATLATATAWEGDLETSAALITEGDTICEAIGAPAAAAFAPILFACIRGDERTAAPLIHTALDDPEGTGKSGFVTYANWAAAILYNGLGHHRKALSAAQAAADSSAHLHMALWALPEVIEAASRSGRTDLATAALARLRASAEPGGTDFGLGLVARSQALLAEGRAVEPLYREAIERLGRTSFRPELGRAHLLFGEWLRRAGRRTDARVQLRTAHELLSTLGVDAFAERARRELHATGERVRSQARASSDTTLTAQESLIAKLARDRATNAEIGAQLFLSARTVEWHLRNVFSKLGIASRRELDAALLQVSGVRPTVQRSGGGAGIPGTT